MAPPSLIDPMASFAPASARRSRRGGGAATVRRNGSTVEAVAAAAAAAEAESASRFSASATDSMTQTFGSTTDATASATASAAASATAADAAPPLSVRCSVKSAGKDAASLVRRRILHHSRDESHICVSGDRVIFAESPSAPGIPIVYRTPEERQANPDRLNLDRRRLTVCPILEGEEHLRLLNFQHNLIVRIQHLASLKRLIFLDLYDNQIDEIAGLNSLRSLRVLMLGKNKIKKIENLEALTKLDVLDLHGNQIMKIERLSHLCELRVLNLAGNGITIVENLAGLESLAELNLRRNKISTITDVENLPCLQRLFLSFNEIINWEEICCLADSHSISELSLDGNPFAGDQFYKQTILRHMHQLRQLDMKRISEEERRIALVMARKEEEKKRQDNRIAIMKEKRRLAISNARRQWEVLQQQQSSLTGHAAAGPPASLPNFVSQFISAAGRSTGVDAATDRPTQGLGQESDSSDRPTSGDSAAGRRETLPASGVAASSISGGANTVISASASRDPATSGANGKIAQAPRIPASDSSSVISGNARGSQASDSKSLPNHASSSSADVQPVLLHSALNVCHLAELEGDCLNLYGSGSLDALDRNWGIQAAGAVITISFKFIEFDEIAKHLHKIRARFPNVQGLIFTETNIYCFQQVNGLASLRRLDSLVVASDGNPVTEFSLWRPYAVFRLAHLQLKRINDQPITQEDILTAERTFGPLATMTSQLPQSRLLSLLGESRKKFLLNLVAAAASSANQGGGSGSGGAGNVGGGSGGGQTSISGATSSGGSIGNGVSGADDSAGAVGGAANADFGGAVGGTPAAPAMAGNPYADRLASQISGIGGGPGTAFTALQVLQGNSGSPYLGGVTPNSSATSRAQHLGGGGGGGGGSETVGRAGLAYVTQDGMARKLEDQETRRQFARNYLLELSKEAILVDRKKTQLQKAWNQIFLEMVERAVLDLRSASSNVGPTSTSGCGVRCGGKFLKSHHSKNEEIGAHCRGKHHMNND